MKEAIEARFEELRTTAKGLRGGLQDYYWFPDEMLQDAFQCFSGAANLIGLVIGNRGAYWQQVQDALKHPDLKTGMPITAFDRMAGILEAVYKDWNDGLLREFEYIIAASTFDDFLDHAGDYHKAGKKTEASVLVSSVLEDTIKKIAKKHGIDSNRTLEPIIDELTSKGVFTPVYAKRVKGNAALRNKALHAEWDAFDIKDVGLTIDGVRKLIEDHL